MGKASKGGYYAVQKGRKQGIYRTWAECEAATKGFAGAVFKKFDSQDAAQAFVQADGYGASSSASTSTSSSSVAGTSRPSYHPYTTTAPSGKKLDKSTAAQDASAPASVLGKRPSHAEPTSMKRLHLDTVFPPAPATTSGGSSSQRKSVVYCDARKN